MILPSRRATYLTTPQRITPMLQFGNLTPCCGQTIVCTLIEAPDGVTYLIAQILNGDVQCFTKRRLRETAVGLEVAQEEELIEKQEFEILCAPERDVCVISRYHLRQGHDVVGMADTLQRVKGVPCNEFTIISLEGEVDHGMKLTPLDAESWALLRILERGFPETV